MYRLWCTILVVLCAMFVIAEGVENEDQFNFLRSLGCDEVQGYIISKPVPAEEVVRLFEETYV